MKVLDNGFVTLEDSMPAGPAPAADKKIEKRARVSNKLPSEVQEEIRTIPQTQGLINYLVKNRHGSPFEGAVFEFYVKCPLFVRSEWHRHRIASYNEMSGRYVEYEPEFYLPEGYRTQGKTNKQGSEFPNDDFTFKTDAITYHKDDWNEQIRHWMEDVVNQSYVNYRGLLAFGVAKEMARMVLPTSLYTAFYMTVNARSLMNFLSLRNADNAQWEIRQYAIALETLFEEKMPMTYKAWVDNGRVAP